VYDAIGQGLPYDAPHRAPASFRTCVHGPFSIMLPRHRACITVTAHYEGRTTDILDAIGNQVVPYLI
jgi:hypothetical protein